MLFFLLAPFGKRTRVHLMRARAILLTSVAWWTATALTVGVLGAQGALGREVVSQCLDRGWTVYAYVRRPSEPILSPVRRGWLSPDTLAVRASHPIASDRLRVLDSSEGIEGTETALVSVMSGRPFVDATETVDLFRDACERLDPTTSRVCLVSAYGVGDSIEGANLGIQVMRDWYLHGTYAAKEEQETYLRTAWNGTYVILRPRVLSYEPIPFNSVARTRSSVAHDVCKWLAA